MFGLRKKKEIKEICSLNKETIKTISSELGIPEEKVPMIAEKLANDEQFIDAIARKINFGVVRRALVSAMAAGAFVATASPALARMTITDQYIQLDDKKYYLPIAPYSAIVYIDGDKVKAENWKGKIISEGEAGVDDASVIQKALDSLTPNRTWKERVVLKGDFILNAMVKVPSYTILQGGKFKIADNANIGAPFFTDFGTHDVEFRQMSLDGNYQNNNSGHGIWGRGDRIKVIDCYIKNVYQAGIAFTGNESIAIRNIIEWDEYQQVDGRDGIHSFGAKHVFKDNIIINAGDTGIAVSETDDIPGHDIILKSNEIVGGRHGIWIHRVKKTLVDGNIIDSPAGYGILVGKLDETYPDPEDITIAKNLIISCGNHGIYIRTATVNGLVVIGNTILNCRGDGLAITHEEFAYRNLISNNYVYGCSNNGLRMWRVHESVIKGNIFENNDYGVYFAIGVFDNVLFTNNVILNNATGAIGGNPNNCIIKNNVGYSTESSGVATFSGDGSTTQFKIAHGLVSTPSKVLVTPMSADAAGDFYVTADDTYIYINYSSAPASGTDNIKVSWYAEV